MIQLLNIFPLQHKRISAGMLWLWLLLIPTASQAQVPDSVRLQQLVQAAEAAFANGALDAALDSLVQASELAYSIQDWISYGDLVSESLTGFAYLEKFEKGWAFSQQIDTAALYLRTGNPHYLGNIMLNSGAIAAGRKPAQIEQAEACLLLALSYYRRIPDSLAETRRGTLANSFQQLSMLEVARQRPDQALHYAWQNYHLLDGLEDHEVRRADALHDLGHYYPMVGKYDSAVWALERASEEYASHLPPTHIELIKSWKNVANGYIGIRDYVKAKYWLNKALEGQQSRSEPDTNAIIFLLHDLARTSSMQGDKASVEEFDQQGLAMARIRQASQQWMYAYSLRENANRMSEADSGRARFLLEEALAVTLETNDRNRSLERGIYGSLAIIFRRQEAFPLARSYYLKNLSIREEMRNDSTAIGGEYINIAGTYLPEQNYQASRAWLDKAKAMIGRPSHPYHSHILGGKGVIFGYAGEIDSCIWFTQAALAHVAQDSSLRGLDPFNMPGPEVLPSLDLVQRLVQKARSLERLYRQHPERLDLLKAAWASYEFVLRMDQELSRHLLLAREAVSLDKSDDFFEGMIGCAILCKEVFASDIYVDRIWHIMEARKARSLVAEQHLTSLLQSESGKAEWRVSLVELEQELVFWEEKKALLGIKDQNGHPEWPYIQSKIFALRSRRREILKEQEGYWQSAVNNIDLPQFQSWLAHDQYALSYFWGDTTLTGLGIGPRGVQLHQWRIGPQAIDSLARLRSALQAPQTSKLAWQQDIFQRWVAPLLPATGLPSRLLILPDGPLHHLPFEALQVQDKALIYSSAIRYAYAGRLIRPEASLARNSQVLTMGPAYPGSVPTISRGITRKSWSDFAPLSYNRKEASTIARLWGGQAWLDENAREAVFREKGPEADILHLAMHAYADPENPQYSALVFSPPGAADTARYNEGFLYSYEIPNLGLQPGLVVLSACETAQGPIVMGEGVMSLARAFAMHDCPRTLTTRWQVDDAATQALMQTFHRGLREGLAPDLALQQAQLAYLHKYPQASPRFWAPFMLVDHSRQSSGSGKWLLGAAALLLVLIGMGFWYMRGRRAAAGAG